MHEVELIKRIRATLRSATDTASPNVHPPPEETIRRVMMATLEILKIQIRPDGEVMVRSHPGGLAPPASPPVTSFRDHPGGSAPPLPPPVTVSRNLEQIDSTATMAGVREYAEGYPVELRVIPAGDGAGRLALAARNEGGCNGTDVDLVDLIGWLRDNRPTLLYQLGLEIKHTHAWANGSCTICGEEPGHRGGGFGDMNGQ